MKVNFSLTLHVPHRSPGALLYPVTQGLRLMKAPPSWNCITWIHGGLPPRVGKRVWRLVHGLLALLMCEVTHVIIPAHISLARTSHMAPPKSKRARKHG